MLAEALRDLVMGEAELLDQSPKAARLLDRVEVCSLQVFDETEHELLVVARIAADDGGHAAQSGKTGRAPAALTGDELVAVGEWAYQQRLQDSVQPDRLGELAERFGVEARADLLSGRPDLVHRDHLRHQRLAVGRHRDQGVETAAESSWSWLAHRSSSSFASARYAAAPRHVGSNSSTDFP